VLLLLVAALAGCGGSVPGPADGAAVGAEAKPAPKPRNAAEIAAAISGGSLGVLVYADRAKGHPMVPKLLALEPVRLVLEGTGLDAEKEVTRIFVSSPRPGHGKGAVAVVQHIVPRDRMRTAVDALIGRSEPPGEWVEDLGVPAARVTIRGQRGVIALIGSEAPGEKDDDPAFVVILPEEHAAAAKQFVGTGGFADPDGTETAIAYAVDPSNNLKVPRGPRIPPSLRTARAKVVLLQGGGADVAIDAQSTSAEQAAEDAAALTRSVDDATSVKVAFIRVRFFKPVAFRAEESVVRGDVHLEAADLDRLLGLANTLGSR
jgi:hypothetical protein